MDTTDRCRIAAYIRVSTEEQANEGVSLQAQEARIRAYATMRNLDVLEVVVDPGVSAGKPLSARKGGARVLELVDSDAVTGVVALKLDRLFRSAIDCLTVVEQWNKTDVALHLVDMGGQTINTSGAMGRFFLTMMAGMAEFERNHGKERTSLAMQQKVRNGEYTGGQPRYGYEVGENGVLIACPQEQEVIAMARELIGSGFSFRGAALALADLGFLSRTGQTFVPHQIRRIVTR